MKKIVAVLMVVSCMAAAYAADPIATFVESAAGSLTVSKMKVGVLVVDAQSYLWPLTWTLSPAKTVVPADMFLTLGIKAEVINKGGQIMVLNPPGMEKILSPFIVMKSGQLDVEEGLAATVPALVTKAIDKLTPDSITLVRDMFNVSEFNGESTRIDQYVATYTKLIKLWGIQKLITVEMPAKFCYIIRGFEIDGSVAASMVFQYYLKADPAGAGYMAQMKPKFNSPVEVKGPDYRLVEDNKVKPEESDLRVYEIIKRISDYLK